MKLLCIDGNSVVNRAYYGIKLLTTKNGRYTNAIVGFMNILLRLEQETEPDAVAVAFDLPAPTFRHKMYTGYKATRHPMPDELAAQLPVLKELLGYLGYVMVTAPGFEADDILGTLAEAGRRAGNPCVIATGDRDAYQLARGGVEVLLATTKFGKGETERVTEDSLLEKFAIPPLGLIEVKALQGDTSDNIPGVAGVGEKTALALIQRFGTVAGVYENLDSPDIAPGVRRKLEAGRESALMSLDLARIATDAPIPTDYEAYRRGPGDPRAAAALLAELEMLKLTQRLGLSGVQTPPRAEAAPAGPLPAALPRPYAGERPALCYLALAGEQAVVVFDEKEDGCPAVCRCDAHSPALAALLADGGCEKRVFDAKAFYRLAMDEGVQARNITFCIKLAAYLLNPSASGYAPDGLMAEYALAPAFTCEAFPHAPMLAPLCAALAQKCEEQGMGPLLRDMELPLSQVLAAMEKEGFRLDAKGVQAYGDALQGTLASSLADIYKDVGYEFNVNSPKQLGEALFERLGLPHGKKTKSGWSTDAETLEGLRGESPVVDAILTYRSYAKLNSTYVQGLLRQVGEDGRVHSVFNQTETRTGRISSNEPNLQNIPVRTELGSGLRKFFTARPGWVLLDADYSQIELRILAHLSGDKAMCDAFLAGEDIHRATAGRIFGLPPEMVTPALRSRAKAVNFGIVYGIGAFSLAKNTGVTVPQAKAFIESYLAQFSGVAAYMEATVAAGRQAGYVTTMYGRRRLLPELRSSNRNIQALGERMARNTPIQGTAADIIKLAMVRVYNRLAAEGLSARLILQVHDELIVEAPLEEADAAAAVLAQEMSRAADLRVPLECDVGRGESWYDAKG